MAELTVLSFNMGHALARDGTVSVERVARLLTDNGADLAGLQDVDRFLPRSYFEDQAAVLGRKLALHHCFAPTGHLPGGLGGGLAILTRYPVLHHTSHRLSLDRTDCVLQRAAVDFAGIRVTCLNACLPLNGTKAQQAWARIRDVCRGLRTPAILTLDAGPGQTDAAMEAFWQRTGANGGLLKIPLRHSRPRGTVFFSPHWKIRHDQVIRTAWSDHWAVTAQAVLETDRTGQPGE